MNNYFRLLLVGSILFVLLGLFNKQAEDKITQNIPAEEIEYVDLQPGLTPVLSRIPNIPSITSDSAGHNHYCILDPKGYENLFSIKLCNQLCSIESDFSDRKPEMHGKTGQFLHLAADRTDLSLL